MLRKKNSPKIHCGEAISGISCISYRGSNLGAGYAAFNLERSPEKLFRIKAFVDGVKTASLIERELRSEVGEVEDATLSRPMGEPTRMAIWQGFLRVRRKDAYPTLEKAIDGINFSLISAEEIRGRIFTFGIYVNIYKEVGYPSDVARASGLESEGANADLWLAHTRQPTNSPGELPVWSHPFASSECAIVHNGDISSFGANMTLLDSWGLQSHIGTDSEVLARLLDHLIRVEGLPIRDAATILTNPYERNLTGETLRLMVRFRGARLDGPFAVVAGYSDGQDVFLIALTDRSKFRPLLMGEDRDRFYVASEENQIRRISPDATIWTPEPGSFFIASLKKGLIESGTKRDNLLQSRIFSNLISPPKSSGWHHSIDASGRSAHEINSEISRAFYSGEDGIDIRNAMGERFIGIGISTRNERERKFKIRLFGFPGNCLANLNDGATFEVFGNAADDVADTMHRGRVIIHGNARDVLGQALQGGDIFVRGCVGNRVGIQMREYRDSRPFVIIGETADDYLGEYMAGGVTCVLNLSDSKNPVGNYVGTGMVGGSIYVRGSVPYTQIGLLPQRADVIEYLSASRSEGKISGESFRRIEEESFPSESLLKDMLPPQIFSRVRSLFFSSKYTKSLDVERRPLTSEELDFLKPKFKEFFSTFSLDEKLLDSVLRSGFTIIKTREEKVERPVPPQDVPIEE